MVSEELEEAFEKERREAKVGERKEKYKKLMKGLGKIEEYVTKKRKGITRPGEAYKFGRQVSPHLMATLTGTKVKRDSKKGDRGRGRPSGTYKIRYLPSGKVVKVPTHVYKKMLSAEKAQMRLMRVQRQMEAEQVAMQQDPRYQPSAEDQFLAEPDQQHEMEVMRAKQEMEVEQQMQQYAPQRPSVGRKIVKGFGDFGRGLSRLGKARPQQPMVDQFGRVIEQPQFRPQPRGMEIRGEPRVTAISERASLLNVPNVFNNPGQSSILWI